MKDWCHTDNILQEYKWGCLVVMCYILMTLSAVQSPAIQGGQLTKMFISLKRSKGNPLWRMGNVISLKWQTGICSVGNSLRSTGPRPTTLEEDWELFVDFSLILCLRFEIHGMRTYNFFDWVSNTGHMVNTGDWQLSSILSWKAGPTGASMKPANGITGSPKQNGSGLKLINSLAFCQTELNEKNQCIISFHCVLV